MIKRAYILAKQIPDFEFLAQRVRAIYFLATPHRGADSATLLTKIFVGTECTPVHCSLYTGCIYRVLTPRGLRNQVVNLHCFATDSMLKILATSEDLSFKASSR